MISEEWWKRPDGREIYCRHWVPEKPKAVVVLIHGFGEHISRYEHVGLNFMNKNIKCSGFDQRGFGQTGRKNGILGFSEGQTYKDIDDFVRLVEIKDVPLFLFGHSMGGGIVLDYATLNPKPFSGVLACSPLIRYGKASMPLPHESLGLKVLPALVPSFALEKILPSKFISRNKQVQLDYEQDPLNHGFCGVFTGQEMEQRMYRILNENWKKFELPLLLIHGDDDGLTDYRGSEAFYGKCKSKDKQLKIFPQAGHELHNELPEVQKEVLALHAKWVLDRS
ncbi:Alpha/Beta hydrolase protein [Gorgonomyces haynaldii]|nr:Alpha/Beta hydrolase protein [Gorgonomyces haynaldii]